MSYKFNKINDFKWEIPVSKDMGMGVPAIIFSNKESLGYADVQEALKQVINVSCLPGILRASFAMPDIHYGYGFPIGGVAAFLMDEGIISPGGVGFDIACGVRLLRSDLEYNDISEKIEPLINEIFFTTPKGIGSKGRIKLSEHEVKNVLEKGAVWAVKNNYGDEDDLEFIEERGCMQGAVTENVSREALKRGSDQVGSLGSGNHFIELQKVEEIFDPKAASVMGIFKNQITIMIHSGSRGFGHQVCTDYLEAMQNISKYYGIELQDRQLACAPINSKEGRSYYSAMTCAVNFAFANRECLTHWVRMSFEKILKKSYRKLNLSLVYDVSHNIAKIEKHKINEKYLEVCVHRKGATRSFSPGSPELPESYKQIGQPVIIPGDMGRYSYLMTGTHEAMEESFGSTCHGAGRLLSRSKARKLIGPQELIKELFEKKGIIIKAENLSGLCEEAPYAYKNAAEIVDIAHKAGLSKKVAKLVPVAVIKG